MEITAHYMAAFYSGNRAALDDDNNGLANNEWSEKERSAVIAGLEQKLWASYFAFVLSPGRYVASE